MEIDREIDELIRGVSHLGRLLTRLAGPGPTRTESTLLSALAERPRRITDLARFVGLTQPRITTAVQSLEQQGLARREPDPADGRAVQVELTERGSMLVEERHRRVVDALIASLSEQPVDAEQLVADAAETVGALVRALEGAPVAR